MFYLLLSHTIYHCILHHIYLTPLLLIHFQIVLGFKMKEDIVALENGVTNDPNSLLDDDGRPKRTGMICLSISLSCIINRLLIDLTKL